MERHIGGLAQDDGYRDGRDEGEGPGQIVETLGPAQVRRHEGQPLHDEGIADDEGKHRHTSGGDSAPRARPGDQGGHDDRHKRGGE